MFNGLKTKIMADDIILSYQSSPKVRQREMLAYSFAIARSLQLESIEEEIDGGKNSITKRVTGTPAMIKQGKLPSRKVNFFYKLKENGIVKKIFFILLKTILYIEMRCYYCIC